MAGNTLASFPLAMPVGSSGAEPTKMAQRLAQCAPNTHIPVPTDLQKTCAWLGRLSAETLPLPATFAVIEPDNDKLLAKLPAEADNSLNIEFAFILSCPVRCPHCGQIETECRCQKTPASTGTVYSQTEQAVDAFATAFQAASVQVNKNITGHHERFLGEIKSYQKSMLVEMDTAGCRVSSGCFTKMRSSA